eukprot:392938-Prymnesium_polylepis.1
MRVVCVRPRPKISSPPPNRDAKKVAAPCGSMVELTRGEKSDGRGRPSSGQRSHGNSRVQLYDVYEFAVWHIVDLLVLPSTSPTGHEPNELCSDLLNSYHGTPERSRSALRRPITSYRVSCDQSASGPSSTHCASGPRRFDAARTGHGAPHLTCSVPQARSARHGQCHQHRCADRRAGRYRGPRAHATLRTPTHPITTRTHRHIDIVVNQP